MDSGIPATEKRRAVGALCSLQRVREEKPLLLLEMSACAKTLLQQQSHLVQSGTSTADIGRRAMLLKKLERHQLLMKQLWNIFIIHLPEGVDELAVKGNWDVVDEEVVEDDEEDDEEFEDSEDSEVDDNA